MIIESVKELFPHLTVLLAVWFKLIIFSILLSFIVALICWYKCRIANRWHWVEFHDQDWCPNVFKQFLRRGMLYENIWNNKYGPSQIVSNVISPFIKQYNISLILDLCSGSCGPSEIINRKLNKNNINNNKPITTILTDLYPQIGSWNEMASKNENVLYVEKSIDATNININEIAKLNGNINNDESMILRTIFLAFHHFSGDLCINIFKDAFKKKDMIIICDADAQKSLFDFIIWLFVQIILTPYGTVKVVYFWLFNAENGLNLFQRITYPIIMIILFPIFLFGNIHDGLVSLARMYDEKQFNEIAQCALNDVNRHTDIDTKYEFKYQRFGFKAGLCVFVCIPK